MHGIERTRKMQGSLERQSGIRRIVVRYSDGRVLNFDPDAGRETYSEDDILEFKEILDRASAKAEWAEVSTRPDS
jgi:hypothetical protein